MINYGSINNPYTEKVGTIKPWPEATAPAGWLICDGSAISRTTYKALFDVIGETYGAGDGTTTFNIPNGNIPVGTVAKLTVSSPYRVGVMQFGTLGQSQGAAFPLCTTAYGTGYIGELRHGSNGINIQSSSVDSTNIYTDLNNATAPTITIIKY